MPVYQYRCKKCPNKFEKVLSISNKRPIVQCPKCHSKSTQRVVSVPTINFVGTGFYVNDSKGK